MATSEQIQKARTIVAAWGNYCNQPINPEELELLQAENPNDVLLGCRRLGIQFNVTPTGTVSVLYHRYDTEE